MSDKMKPEIARLPFYQPMLDGPVAIAHQTNTPSKIESASQIMTEHDLPPYVEIDVTTNRDGTPMVFHGANWPHHRMERGLHVPSGFELRRMSNDDFSRYNSRHPEEPISTLEEILGDFPKVRFILHLKNDQPASIAKILKSTNSFANVAIGAMRGKTLRELDAILSKMEKKVAMIVAATDSAFALYATDWPAKRFEKPEQARQRLDEVGYATGGQTVPIVPQKFIAGLRKNLGIPMIVANQFPRKEETPEFFDQQYAKGLNGFMADNIAMLAVAAARARRRRV